jgi:hypothetical protein
LFELGIGVRIDVTVLDDVAELGVLDLEDKVAGKTERIEAAADVFFFLFVDPFLVDVTVGGADEGLFADFDFVGKCQPELLGDFVWETDLVFVIVGDFTVVKGGEASGGADDAVVEAFGVGVEVVLGGAVEALDGIGEVDEAEEGGVAELDAVFAEFFELGVGELAFIGGEVSAKEAFGCQDG